MDAQFIIGMVVQTAILVGGAYVFLQKREDRIMDKVDKKIEPLKVEIERVKESSFDRMGEIKDMIHDMEKNFMNQVQAVLLHVQRIANKVDFTEKK